MSPALLMPSDATRVVSIPIAYAPSTSMWLIERLFVSATIFLIVLLGTGCWRRVRARQRAALSDALYDAKHAFGCERFRRDVY